MSDSSAGGLIGLQFVVITLIANRPIVRGQAEAGAALLLTGIQTAPWRGVGAVAILWCGLDLCVIAYEVLVARRNASPDDIRSCL